MKAMKENNAIFICCTSSSSPP